MPLYFFSLTDDMWPYQAGEDLPNDQEARKHAEKLAEELTRNATCISPKVRVFDATGKRVT